MNSAYYLAMREALLAGFYVPELESVYFKHDSFTKPRIFICDPLH